MHNSVYVDISVVPFNCNIFTLCVLYANENSHIYEQISDVTAVMSVRPNFFWIPRLLKSQFSDFFILYYSSSVTGIYLFEV